MAKELCRCDQIQELTVGRLYWIIQVLITRMRGGGGVVRGQRQGNVTRRKQRVE